MIKKVIFFSLLFVLSRLIFINSSDIFFDSAEYASRITSPSYYTAITTGHIPLHSGYPFIFWPFYFIFSKIGLNAIHAVIQGQVLLGLCGILSYGYIVARLCNKKIALISSIFASIIPIFWITNVTIMMETTYVSLFFISWAFLIYGQGKKSVLWIFFSVAIMTVSLLTHMGSVLWFPLILISIWIIFDMKHVLNTLFLLFFSFSFFSVINAWLISPNNMYEGFSKLFLDHLQERSIDITSFVGISRIIRNWVLPNISNNTSIIFFGGVTTLILSALKKNKNTLLLLSAWILPSIVTNQWWDSLLFGRHALIASFGLCLGISILIYQRKVIVSLTMLIIFFISIQNLTYLRKPIPYLEVQSVVNLLPKNSLYIESHFARPQIQDTPNHSYFFVDEIGYDISTLNELISNFFEHKKRVFISSQALSEPYGLYSGPYLHPISLSYKKEYILSEMLKDYSFKEYKILNKEDNLIVFELFKSESKNEYPKITQLKNSKRRMDYFDPFSSILRRTGII